MIYPQNGDRIVGIDFVTSLLAMHSAQTVSCGDSPKVRRRKFGYAIFKE